MEIILVVLSAINLIAVLFLFFKFNSSDAGKVTEELSKVKSEIAALSATNDKMATVMTRQSVQQSEAARGVLSDLGGQLKIGQQASQKLMAENLQNLDNSFLNCGPKC